MYNLERLTRRQQCFDNNNRKEHVKAIELEKKRNQDNLDLVNYHRISLRHYAHRMRQIYYFTDIQDSYDNYIRHHIEQKNHPDYINIEKKQRDLNKNLTKFLKKLRNSTIGDYYDVSDDTKAIEYRPNKRDSARLDYTSNSANRLQRPKRSRSHPSTDSIDDFTVAGPSTNPEKFFIHM